MGNIINFTGATTLDTDPDDVLKAAIGELEHVIVIGVCKKEHTENGERELYFASSTSDSDKNIAMAERFKHFLLKENDNE